MLFAPGSSAVVALLGLLGVLVWRIREGSREVTLKTIVFPPLGMATGFSMFCRIWFPRSSRLGARSLPYRRRSALLPAHPHLAARPRAGHRHDAPIQGKKRAYPFIACSTNSAARFMHTPANWTPGWNPDPISDHMALMVLENLFRMWQPKPNLRRKTTSHLPAVQAQSHGENLSGFA
jgi:hypothetical protein